MVQFLQPEIVIMVQFLVQIFVSRILANTENQLPRLPGSALKVCGGGVVVGKTVIMLSLQLELS